MRMQGIVKVIATLAVSFFIISIFVGEELAFIVTAFVTLYAWIGEYIALWRAGAISEDKLNVYEKNKLQCIKEMIAGKVERFSGEDISGIKLHIIPDDGVNAMAYGFNNVSFTKGAIESCDEMTLCAIFSHEISHILCLDAVFNRVILADFTVIIIGLMTVSFVTVSFLWLLFLVLILAGICRGFLSIFITSSLVKGVKGIFEIVQQGILFICQVIMAAISRCAEYRADQLAVDLGFGVQLSYFLKRFVQDNGRKSLTKILYASHPAPYLRVQRIEQRQG